MRILPLKFSSSRASGRFRAAKTVAMFTLSVVFPGGQAFPQSASEVQTYQEMLIWTGDYDGTIDGKLGAGTLQAIKHFQERNHHNPSGDLSDKEVALLVQQGRSRKQAAGFGPYRDIEAGVTVGIPSKLVANPTRSKWGTSWSAIDDRINIDTLHVTGTTLRELFDKLSAFRNRRVKYSVFRGDWFVISGLDVDDAAVYVRAAADPSGDDVRGFSVRIAKEWRDELGPIPIAMSSSFRTLSQPLVSNQKQQQPSPPGELQPNPAPRYVAQPASIRPCFNGLGDCPAAFSDR
jgi:peptidoglycan hydrolase-like protein with peptidoglycan-binding domain